MRRRLQPWWVSVAVTAPTPGLVTLVQGTDGGLYGTTDNLGDGPGTVFRLGTNGTLTTVYKFCSLPNCADGDLPISGVIVGTDGNLYGVTYEGGANDYGTVFRLTLSGSLTTLYSFCNLTGCTDGRNPYGGLVEGSDGNLYGTTAAGGTSEGGTGAGTIFKITSAGLLKTLYTFCPQGGLCSDGASPQAALTEVPMEASMAALLVAEGRIISVRYSKSLPAVCLQACGILTRVVVAPSLLRHSFNWAMVGSTAPPPVIPTVTGRFSELRVPANLESSTCFATKGLARMVVIRMHRWHQGPMATCTERQLKVATQIAP